MRKSIKKIIMAILCIFVLLSVEISVNASTIIHSNGYILKVEDDDYTQLDGWEDEGFLNVPNSVDSYYISAIADYAFMDNESLTGVSFNDALTLKKLGYLSFFGCKNIAGNITIPARINSLGAGAFQECSSVESVDLYSGSREIPAQMFYDCDSLSEVNINYGFTSIGKLAFGSCENLETVQISWTVNDIHETAFDGCPNLTIYCYYNSSAHQYAVDHNINYVLVDKKNYFYLQGDADDSDIVDISDVTMIQRALARLIEYDDRFKQRGDANRDGELIIDDATQIQRYLAHLPYSEGIGEAIIEYETA